MPIPQVWHLLCTTCLNAFGQEQREQIFAVLEAEFPSEDPQDLDNIAANIVNVALAVVQGANGGSIPAAHSPVWSATQTQ